jgi:valyl-tRNA synthetase
VRPLTISTGELAARSGALIVAGPLTARLHLPEADPATLAADRARRERDLAAAREQLAAAEARLADPAFTDKAPEKVVAGARKRVEELRGEIARLTSDPA